MKMRKQLEKRRLGRYLVGVMVGLWCVLATATSQADIKVALMKSVWSAKKTVSVEKCPGLEAKDSTLTLQKGQEPKLIVKTGKKYAWPGATFRGNWDLSKYNQVSVEVQNPDKEKSISLTLRVDDPASGKANQGWRSTTIQVEPGKTAQLTASLPAPVPAYITEKVFGMRGLPGNIQADTNTGKASARVPFDTSNVTAIWIYTTKEYQGQTFAVTNITAETITNAPKNSWSKMSESEFFPMIDQFGQFKHSEWPGKIHNERELKANVAKEAKDIAAHPAPADWNEYGGWANGPKLKATGHFRVEKQNGKWWLVDPSGRLFWSHGVDCVRVGEGITGISGREHLYENLPKEGTPMAAFYGKSSWAAHGFYHENKNYTTYNFTGANLLRKYGPEWRQTYADLVHKRIPSWGMNTIANWSDPAVYMMRKTPYTITCGTGNFRIEGSSGFWGKFPDPFHPGFRAALVANLKRHKDSLDDPWCIGIFVNNEISWGNDTSLSEGSLVSPVDQPSKKAMMKWLKEKYTDVDKLNKVWGTTYVDWNAVAQTTELPKGKGKTADMKAFYTVIAEEYFKVIHEELRKAAPNKLDLGCRFAWSNDLAVLAAVKYVDVVSFNKYAYTVADFKLPENADMPCIIGEFHFGALDRGMLHTGLRKTTDQNDRALKYEEYVRGALMNPFWVGTHWFQFGSQATTGRTDGENYQIGMLDVCDTPYVETIEAVRRVGKVMYQLRANGESAADKKGEVQKTEGKKTDSVSVTFTFKDNKSKTITVPLTAQKDYSLFRLSRESVPANVKNITVIPDFASANSGDKGFFVLPNGMYGTFRAFEKDNSYYQGGICMPIFGMSTPNRAFLAIVDGYRYGFGINTTVKKNVWSCYPRFNLDGDAPYEDITIKYYFLNPKTATYADMAKIYRKYQLDSGVCVPLAERMKTSPELTYLAQGPEIRIRQGWKPAPPKVMEQKVSEEPKMRVAVTFDRVKDIIDEFKKNGIDKAQFCLVGWNIRGHDGRYPQLFPVEEGLGGEAKLRELIKYAQSNGYQIVCHTNVSDAYSISNIWSEDYIIKTKDGKLSKNAPWSGGQMYNICPLRSWDVAVKPLYDRVVELGFRGVHYVDVLSIVNPRVCYDPKHPSNGRQSAEALTELMGRLEKMFGGIASEGPWDFCCSKLDYVLYVSFNLMGKRPPIVERIVPFWQLVYHGIILSNPSAETTNYMIKDRTTQLKLVEFGGRPMFYFYSKFRDTTNWMGEIDVTCEDDADLHKSVAAIKKSYGEYRQLRDLQTKFMDSHDEIADNVFRTGYSDGSEIITNYTERPFEYKGKTVKSQNWLLIRP